MPSDTPDLPLLSPLVTREVFATLTGLPLGVVVAQVSKGYWPTVRVGKYSLINIEAVRLQAAARAKEFLL